MLLYHFNTCIDFKKQKKAELLDDDDEDFEGEGIFIDIY